MTVKPISDIVLDVARAADPARVSAAVRSLDANVSDFSSSLTAADTARLTGGSLNMSSSAPSLLTTAGLINRSSSAATPTAASFHKLEAFFLQTVLQDIMPNNADSVFGTGTAGNAWRSMLAEHVANKIADSGAIGIAKRLTVAQDKIDAARQAAAASAQAPTSGTTAPDASNGSSST